MKAAVNTRYGSPDVIEIRDVLKPEPATDEVLVRVYATTVGRTDCGQLRAHPFFVRALTGLRRPKRTILGFDFAGEVEAVREGVKAFKPGDRVFGLSPGGYGGHAEYLCVPEAGTIAAMPAGIGFDEAVVGEGALYANSNLQALRVGPGHKILIYGASGAIGTAAVQLARWYGAEVTAVVDTSHLELARSLGAHRVVDYTAEDLTQIGTTFDFIFDAVGKASYFRYRGLLKPGGVFATTDFGPRNQNLPLLIWGGITRRRRVILGLPNSSKAFVGFLAARLQAGELRAVIDREYPLEKIADAYRYVETGQKTGIVVVNVSPFKPFDLPSGERAWIPSDLHVAVPDSASIAPDLLHYLVYIPWDRRLLDLVDPEYRDFFSFVLPHLHVRTTDVHVATCLRFAKELIRATPSTVDERVVHVAFILHDSGWSQMTEAEMAASLGVEGLALSGAAIGPKARHVELGRDLAERILSEYIFDPPLSDRQKEMIYTAILFHDKPEELAAMGGVPAEIQMVCDTDHLWSFTHENFWQDTVRKGVDPRVYLENLGEDLDGYFVTEPGKRRAARMLEERRAEVEAWEDRT